jgi:hypothetical protein
MAKESYWLVMFISMHMPASGTRRLKEPVSSQLDSSELGWLYVVRSMLAFSNSFLKSVYICYRTGNVVKKLAICAYAEAVPPLQWVEGRWHVYWYLVALKISFGSGGLRYVYLLVLLHIISTNLFLRVKKIKLHLDNWMGSGSWVWMGDLDGSV